MLHYITHGAIEKRSGTPLFDPHWYAKDDRHSKLSPRHFFDHYVTTGWYEGVNPGPLFMTAWYLRENSDVADSGMNPLIHYLRYGRKEGRRPNPWFDPMWYLAQYPDVASAGLDPLEHYMVHGALDGRNPSSQFDTLWYLSQYPDVAEAGFNPLVHFLKYGQKEGRLPKAGDSMSIVGKATAPSVLDVASRLPAPSPSKPRVVFCSHDLKLQGAPKSLFEVITGLAARGAIDPVVLSPYDGPLRTQYEARGIPLAVVEGGNIWNGKTSERFHRAVELLEEAFVALHPAAVFANTFTMFHAVYAAQQGGIPAILNPRESEPPDTFFDEFPSEVRSHAYRTISTADRVIFVAGATCKQWEFANERDSFAVIRNALPAESPASIVTRATDRQSARSEYGIAPEDIVFACVGTVTPRKGQMDIVQAFARLSEPAASRSQLLILGMSQNDYSKEVESVVGRMPPSRRGRVHLLPQTTSIAEASRVRGVYLAADVFVLSSRIESYPRVVLEAMAYSLPIITTPCFGVVEQVRDGIEALYYEDGNCETLARHMSALIDNPMQRRAMAEAIEQRAVVLGTHDDMLAAYEAEIAEVLGSSRLLPEQPQGRVQSSIAAKIQTKDAEDPDVSKWTLEIDIGERRLSLPQALALVSLELCSTLTWRLVPDRASVARDGRLSWFDHYRADRPVTLESAGGPGYPAVHGRLEELILEPDAGGGWGSALADLLNEDICVGVCSTRNDRFAARAAEGLDPFSFSIVGVGDESQAGDALRTVLSEARSFVSADALISPELLPVNVPTASEEARKHDCPSFELLCGADGILFAAAIEALPLALALAVALEKPLMVIPAALNASERTAWEAVLLPTGTSASSVLNDPLMRPAWLKRQRLLQQERREVALACLAKRISEMFPSVITNSHVAPIEGC
jgi:glycosyltransferase involved in cell wall biosynthesis